MIESSPMKILLTILLFALPSIAQIDVKYDKFKDQTIVRSDERWIDAGIQLTAVAMFKGETKSDDVRCYLIFTSRSRDWQYLKSHELIFLADGERIMLGNGRHEGEVGTRYAVVKESMLYPVTKDDLALLAKASSLEMKLGGSVVKFGEKDKKPIQELAQYVAK